MYLGGRSPWIIRGAEPLQSNLGRSPGILGVESMERVLRARASMQAKARTAARIIRASTAALLLLMTLMPCVEQCLRRGLRLGFKGAIRGA